VEVRMSSELPLPGYLLEYDEEIDAICSLEVLADHLPKVITTPYQWKWAILAVHNALQGFMVLALKGTRTLNVLSERSAKQWIAFYESGKMPTDPQYLDYFMPLFDKIQSEAMLLRNDSRRYEPMHGEQDSVRRINAVRNEFAHYIPASSLYDMGRWSRDVELIIPIIEFLAFESHNITLHQADSAIRIGALCGIIKAEASALHRYYDPSGGSTP
jgi:hypothetical protein